MDHTQGCLKSAWRLLLALAVVVLAPLTVEAAGIGFKNDTNQMIYIQGCSIINGKPVRGPLLQIPPGKTLWDIGLMKGERHIKITNAANQVLFDAPCIFDGTDTFYGVIPVVYKGPPKVFLEKRPLPPAN
jgi:hypothetical protein